MHKGPTTYVQGFGLSKRIIDSQVKFFWNFGFHFVCDVWAALCRTGFNDHMKGRPVIFWRASEIKRCGSIGRKVQKILRCCSCWCRCVFYYFLRKKASPCSIIGEHVLYWRAGVWVYVCLCWGRWTAYTQGSYGWTSCSCENRQLAIHIRICQADHGIVLGRCFLHDAGGGAQHVEGSTVFKPDVFKVPDQSCCMLEWPSQHFSTYFRTVCTVSAGLPRFHILMM